MTLTIEALATDEHARAVVARAIFGPPGPPMIGPQYAHHRRRAGEAIRALAACCTSPDVSGSPLAPLTTNETREDT